MPRYKYKARNQYGEAVFGYAEAEDLDRLKTGLKERGLWVIEAKPERRLWLPQEPKAEEQTVKPLELIMFSKQMGVMLNSGLSLINALLNFEEGASDRFRPVIFNIVDSVKSGKTYAEALASYPRIFSPFFTGMIEVGEAGGLLAEMHQKLARHLEQAQDLKNKIGVAAIYPSVVFAVTVIGVLVILVYAFPKIADIYTKHHVQLPLITRFMIGISNFAINFWYLPLIVIAGIVMLFVRFKIHKKTRIKQWLDRLIFKLPFYGEFTRQIILARFTVNLSLLLQSGIPLLRSLSILQSLIGNQLVQNYLTELMLSVQEGEGMAAYFKRNRFFPSMMVSMIRTGEESGELTKMTQEAGIFFEAQVEEGVKKFVAVIEPFLIVLAAGVVFLVLIAFYLPMFKMFRLLRS